MRFHALVPPALFTIIALLAALLLSAARVDADASAGNRPPSKSQHASEQPRELGQVAWLRDFDAAETRARAEGKPLFVLFQEVPGCQTCVHFGEQVLSHSLMVEAIEDEFIPVAIYNNEGGADRRILERFGEPAWNNPVVRFVAAGGHELLPRRDRLWQSAEIADRMIRALEAADRIAPDYLVDLRNELGPEKIERATLSMGCYWAGEACLGALPGLISTRTGDLGGREVVEVRFDATRSSYAQVLQFAKKNDCAEGVFAHGADQLAMALALFGSKARTAPGIAASASARHQKYHLKRVRGLARLDLTPAQATRVNTAVWQERPVKALLSPRQKAEIED